jgi:hypothetical protein
MQAIVPFVEGHRRVGCIAGAIVAKRMSWGQQVAGARASPTSSSSTWSSQTSTASRSSAGINYGTNHRALGLGPGGRQNQGARLGRERYVRKPFGVEDLLGACVRRQAALASQQWAEPGFALSTLR